jgi:hypothetical protein
VIGMACITLSDVDRVIRTTEKAVLVRFKNVNQEDTWISRSACACGDDLTEGDSDVVVQKWFAEREGLV